MVKKQFTDGKIIEPIGKYDSLGCIQEFDLKHDNLAMEIRGLFIAAQMNSILILGQWMNLLFEEFYLLLISPPLKNKPVHIV